MYNKIIEKINIYNKLAILGFGKEGKSTYNFIRRYLPNKKITILDSNVNLLDSCDFLNNDKNIELILGESYLNNLEKYDLIMKSPGVKIPESIYIKIENRINSQMALAVEFYKDNIIGITGTKGKSTTSSLLYKVLNDQNIDCLLLGNVGNPIFDYIEKINENTILVIEMSSYQAESIKHSPHIGIVLNLFEEHLNYHGTLDNYYYSKLNMFRYQSINDYALYTSNNETLKSLIETNNYLSNKIDVAKEFSFVNDDIYYNKRVVFNRNEERLLQGSHNLNNILFVIRVAIILNLDLDKVKESIKSFKPLEHRMEYVGTFNGIKYYNDAIATIPEATINCIETVKNVDSIIFGGLDRGIDYNGLIDYFNNSNIKNFICMPETGYKIADRLVNKEVYKVDTLENAVKIAKEVTKDICILSPAAPSYNAFKNFEEKGKKYKELVSRD